MGKKKEAWKLAGFLSMRPILHLQIADYLESTLNNVFYRNVEGVFMSLGGCCFFTLSFSLVNSNCDRTKAAAALLSHYFTNHSHISLNMIPHLYL